MFSCGPCHWRSLHCLMPLPQICPYFKTLNQWLRLWGLRVLPRFEECLRVVFRGLTSSVSFSQE